MSTEIVRPYVPDHKTYFAAFDAPEPTYYLCALLSAPIVREWIKAHNVSIQVGDVFRHMNLPRFDAEDPQHQRLAPLSQQAHQTHNDVMQAGVVAQIEPASLTVLTA